MAWWWDCRTIPVARSLLLIQGRSTRQWTKTLLQISQIKYSHHIIFLCKGVLFQLTRQIVLKSRLINFLFLLN